MKSEILKIIKGHDSGSCFWIMPVKVIDVNKDTDASDNLEEALCFEISIEEDYVYHFLFPFIVNSFDENLTENVRRNSVIEKEYYMNGLVTTFVWNLTYNFFEFNSIRDMLADIENAVDLLKNDYDNHKLDVIKSQYDFLLSVLNCDYEDRKNPVKSKLLIKENIGVIINFYERFIKHMEQMLTEGGKKGYHLISFMGP